MNDAAAANRVALVEQLYDEWHGYYVLQRLDGGTYVDVRPLSRDEALTIRPAPDEALELKWNTRKGE